MKTLESSEIPKPSILELIKLEWKQELFTTINEFLSGQNHESSSFFPLLHFILISLVYFIISVEIRQRYICILKVYMLTL